VFRSDLPVRFKCKPAAYQQLLDNLDRDMQYAIAHDAHWQLEDCDNYQEVGGGGGCGSPGASGWGAAGGRMEAGGGLSLGRRGLLEVWRQALRVSERQS
jgi:hypothetical protein